MDNSEVNKSMEDSSSNNVTADSTGVGSVQEPGAKQKKVFIIVAAALLVAVVFFAIGLAIVNIIQPKPQPENSQENQTPEQIEQNKKVEVILDVQDQLTRAVSDIAYGNPDVSGDEVASAFNEEIEKYEDDETRRIAELQKIYLLIEGAYYQEATVELQKIETMYPKINEECDFNIHGYNLAQRTENAENKQSYQSRIDKYCPNLMRFE